MELSNLEKTLFPATDRHEARLKAELIQYYLQISPTLLKHIKGRPLSMIRFPDGIEGQSFYQKNKPEWAPPWLESQRLGEKQIDYVIATEQATLVWLANLACVELHPWHSRSPHFDKPDYIVFDLDPPEGYNFPSLCQLALDLREHLMGLGYHPFVKTTGGKGLHILTPIEPKWSYHEVFEAAKAAAQPFVERRKDATLQIVKNARKGRVLIDIYRNREGQTIVGPYSVRANPGAPVSMPLEWDEVPDLTDPHTYHLGNALEKVKRYGDAWEVMPAYAVPIHTQRKREPVKQDLGENPHHKTPEQLAEYARKRDFEKTNEPVPVYAGGNGDAFVVHRHHASRMHYDLRLEEKGVLRSWAVPRGLPPRPGIKRLAVQTEDHPMEYLTFEGEIPKGQYGAGPMWSFAQGRYEITKVKKTGFYFRLASRQITAEYRIHKTRDQDWLLERVDQPQVDWLDGETYSPMLCQAQKDVPDGDDWIYEVKWDGFRALIYVEEGEVRIFARSGKEMTDKFPELLDAEGSFRAGSAVFDGEIVCLDDAGRPDFRKLLKRFQRGGGRAAERARLSSPAYCYLFDVLYLDGRPLVDEPLFRRYEWLASTIKTGPYRLSEQVEDGPELFSAAEQLGLEGIVAKRKSSRYIPAKRSDNWVKIKVRSTADCIILGYTFGKGDREDYFGALHIAEEVSGNLIYRGRVGSGFSDGDLKEYRALLDELATDEKPIEENVEEEKRTQWIKPEIRCEIQYASITANSTFREPVFLKMKGD